MIRNLIEKPFAEGVKYLEAAGLSTDTKPTEGLITGSRFTEDRRRLRLRTGKEGLNR